jgi:spore germination protein
MVGSAQRWARQHNRLSVADNWSVWAKVSRVPPSPPLLEEIRVVSRTRLLVIGIIGIALGATSGAVVVGSASAEPAPRRIVSGWLPYWTMPSALASATANGDLWSDASPFWYEATGAATIVNHTGAGDPAVRDALVTSGIKVLPTVTESLTAPQMAALLGDASQRAAHVNTLVGLVTANGYDGIDLDYENMNFGTSDPAVKSAVRTGFVTFAGELKAALAAQGRLLSITIGPRTSSTDSNWAVFDYAGIGAVADTVRILTYDYHYSGSSPGAIAPQPWVERVLAYAVTAIPADRVQVGVPLYGYDWVCSDPMCTAKESGTRATALTYAQVETLRLAKGATREWSATDAAPSFTYIDDAGKTHAVWYNDAESTMAKMSLVGKYYLAGMALWAVGSEDTAQWTPLRDYAVSIAKTSRSVSISTPPSSITYPAKLTLTGTVKNSAGIAVPGQKVVLQRRNPTSSTWGDVGTAASSSTGSVSMSYTPSSNSVFRLYAPSNWTYDAATSGEKTTMVKWKVSAAASDATPVRSQRISIKGKVSPTRAGTTVQRQKLVNGSWQFMSATTVTSDGTYSFSVLMPSKSATLSYRIKVPGTVTNATAYSSTIRLTVP